MKKVITIILTGVLCFGSSINTEAYCYYRFGNSSRIASMLEYAIDENQWILDSCMLYIKTRSPSINWERA